eukprot:20696-Pelagococcus_subviridis.AAC.1
MQPSKRRELRKRFGLARRVDRRRDRPRARRTTDRRARRGGRRGRAAVVRARGRSTRSLVSRGGHHPAARPADGGSAKASWSLRGSTSQRDCPTKK